MNKYYIILLLTSALNHVNGQVWNPSKNCIIDNATGECVTNTLLTALPFLHINPDARSGGLGDAGVATSPDPNSMHFNPSKLAFVDNDFSISATLSPWLRSLNIDDIYLLYLSGYKKVGKDQTVGGAIRYFSLGSIDFRDEVGNDLGTGRPNEFEIVGSYARKLTPKLSASLSAKFVWSSLATGRNVSGIQIFPARTFAADIGVFYKTPMGASGRRNYLSLGAAITNLGAKVTYTKSTTRDFIPTNLGLGANYEMNFDDYNSLNLILDINKLMVPSTIPPGNPDFDANGNQIADIRERALFEGVFGSFTDATGGFAEELQEITLSPALEYWYDKQFAVRMGYFYEHALKGNRKFFTLGTGVKYNVFTINISYLVPTNINRSPLANTLRFSFVFDLGAAQKNAEN
jgi:hypothetical protein